MVNVWSTRGLPAAQHATQVAQRASRDKADASQITPMCNLSLTSAFLCGRKSCFQTTRSRLGGSRSRCAASARSEDALAPMPWRIPCRQALAAKAWRVWRPQVWYILPLRSSKGKSLSGGPSRRFFSRLLFTPLNEWVGAQKWFQVRHTGRRRTRTLRVRAAIASQNIWRRLTLACASRRFVMGLKRLLFSLPPHPCFILRNCV